MQNQFELWTNLYFFPLFMLALGFLKTLQKYSTYIGTDDDSVNWSFSIIITLVTFCSLDIFMIFWALHRTLGRRTKWSRFSSTYRPHIRPLSTAISGEATWGRWVVAATPSPENRTGAMGQPLLLPENSLVQLPLRSSVLCAQHTAFSFFFFLNIYAKTTSFWSW